MLPSVIRFPALLIAIAAAGASAATPVLKGSTERPLRFAPVDGGFEITNGPDRFNRPLYGGPTAFRVDAGDRPEFSLYLPGRGGVVRVGLASGGKTKWLRDAGSIRARYADGAMAYAITDPAFAGVTVRLTVVALRDGEGLAIEARVDGATTPVELLFAYGGVTGEKHPRNGDIGTDRVPMSQYFALKPEHCRDTKINTEGAGFRLTTKTAEMSGSCTGSVYYAAADAATWDDAAALRQSADRPTERPVALVVAQAKAGVPTVLALKRVTPPPIDPKGVPTTTPTGLYLGPGEAEPAFAKAVEQNRAVARRVVVDTPDPFINAAVPAMCLAADAIKDKSGTVMHGGVAWRMPLLGWRGPYAFDATGDHAYAASHLAAYFKKQNVDPVTTQPVGADASENLARSEKWLRSNGDLTDAHYDMNLAAVDMFFRHLLWTGDLEYAKANWPVIERHLAWEKRLFRRPFGPGNGLPLYEAYACIWASDDLQYSGGGVTHASAYNYFHNTMAARVALLIGKDPKPYDDEAELIRRAMRSYLWLPEQGCFAEYKDWLGNQLVHPAAALWTHYTTIDSQVPDAFQAWQMCRYVDTQIPHIPVHGPGVPPGLYTLPSSTWMPYMWSTNNVAMAEVTHTALADWQAGRPDAAFSIFKGAIVDSMFMGQCPGNLHMTSFFDAYRQEAQRDSGDPIGITWRALVEGLFGITPDALKGQLKIRPGFPTAWDYASIRHPNVHFDYRKQGDTDTFVVEPKFSRPMRLVLDLPARRTNVAGVTVNGVAATWWDVDDAIERPRIEIAAGPAERWDVAVTWSGDAPEAAGETIEAVVGETVSKLPPGGNWMDEYCLFDRARAMLLFASAYGFVPKEPGRFELLKRNHQGDLTWWQPVPMVVRPKDSLVSQIREDLRFPVAYTFDPIDVASGFNDRVTQIFKNKYVSPRSPFCSLAMPTQGFGGWASNKTTPTINDTGLRALGGTLTLPDGVPFRMPAAADAKNVLFVSQWDNYPRDASVPLTGRAAQAVLLMAGTTNAMQSRLDNGEVIVTYADGGTDRLALRNPETWWPIEQDYFVDDYGFDIPAVLPMRVDLKTGKVRVPTRQALARAGRSLDGGAATVLNLPLDPKRELKSLTVRAIANEVVIGLMGVTLQRP